MGIEVWVYFRGIGGIRTKEVLRLLWVYGFSWVLELLCTPEVDKEPRRDLVPPPCGVYKQQLPIENYIARWGRAEAHP